jgi:hypothetical protein
MSTAAPLRLRTAAVTVLLGDRPARSEVLGALDESTARCGGGHRSAARRWRCSPSTTAEERVRELAELVDGCALLLVEGATAGLEPAGRRRVVDALRAASRTGTAVLVDDPDPIAVLAVADAALRVAPDGALTQDDLDGYFGL